MGNAVWGSGVNALHPTDCTHPHGNRPARQLAHPIPAGMELPRGLRAGVPGGTRRGGVFSPVAVSPVAGCPVARTHHPRGGGCFSPHPQGNHPPGGEISAVTFRMTPYVSVIFTPRKRGRSAIIPPGAF